MWLSPFVNGRRHRGVASVVMVLLLAQSAGSSMSRYVLVPKIFSPIHHPAFRTPWKELVTGLFAALLAGDLRSTFWGELVSIGTLPPSPSYCVGVMVLRGARPLARAPSPAGLGAAPGRHLPCAVS